MRPISFHEESRDLRSKNIFMGLKKETITYIGTENRKQECEQFINASEKLVMPGLVNLRSPSYATF
jgi:cytosine/adenosine deaminase-related metal-dependent hydrolase